MYTLCMVGSGNGPSKCAEMLIGHVWGGPVVGTTIGNGSKDYVARIFAPVIEIIGVVIQKGSQFLLGYQ